MSVNSSSSSFASSSNNMYSFLQYCFKTRGGTYTITTFSVASILVVLPLYIYVLFLGLQRWQRQHSSTVTSHSDIFTYHMAAIELTGVLGVTLSCCGVYTHLPQMINVGICLFIINLFGQLFLHLLTCVERYLAVVHPVTYRSLRKEKGIRIRNISISCVWLLSFAGMGLLFVQNQVLIDIMSYSFVAFLLIFISFCSLSVLCVLIRPGPGEGGGARQWVDQSKLRAFYTIVAILGVLLFRFVWCIIGTALYDSPQVGGSRGCAVWMSNSWFGLPSSLVLPLLFLHRSGKLDCCKTNNESRQG